MERFVGIIIMVASTVLYASLTPLEKKANAELAPMTIMAISMFVLFLLSFIGSIIFEHPFSIKPEILKANILPLVLVGILNFFGFLLLILGFKHFPIWQQQMFYLLTPIIAGIIAYFVLGEVITVRLFIGLAIIAVGLFVGLR